MIRNILKQFVVKILTFESKMVLKKYNPQIVAITGSVGKTATKDAVRTVLEKKFYVRSSEKSFNSEVGVPLTILGFKKSGWVNPLAWLHIFFEGALLILLKNHYPKILVLEVGTDRSGDIERITRWLTPDVTVVTRFGDTPVHIEFFPSRDALIQEKKHLVRAVKEGGTIVLNADDKDVLRIRDEIKNVDVFTYGIGKDASLRSGEVKIFYEKENIPQGIEASIFYKEERFLLKIRGTVGMQYVYVALAAACVGSVYGIHISDAIRALSAYVVPPGRGKILPGIGGSVVLDDSYNSSPTAVEAALRAMQSVSTRGRKIIALGDMLELGKMSNNAHWQSGAFAAHVGDILVTVGPRARLVGEAALEQGMQSEALRHFDSSDGAEKYIRGILKENDIVLVKGSQSMRMERITKGILKDPTKAKTLLVRQGKEWARR